jgi:hypothetical protein
MTLHHTSRVCLALATLYAVDGIVTCLAPQQRSEWSFGAARSLTANEAFSARILG